jgi:hypothetical protein
VLSRLRQAFIPRDPLYRRESGAGRRVILIAKLVGACTVFGAYVFWLVAMLGDRFVHPWGEPILAVASCLLCVLAFVLGLQSVRGEVADGTAQSLILTPLSRWKIVTSKLAGSVEFLAVAALLLPLYWFAVEWRGCNDFLMAHLHGGLLRFGTTGEMWRDGDCSPGGFTLGCLVTGTAAFAADLAWYALLAACGMFAATSARTTGGAWTKGLALAAALAIGLALLDWLGFDLAGEHPTWASGWSATRASSLLDGLTKLDYRDLAAAFDVSPRSSRPPVWAALWLSFAISLRLGLAWLFLKLAARRFDRIATD